MVARLRLLELAELVLPRSQLLGRELRAGAQSGCHLREQPVVVAQQLHRLGAGDGLDPPHIGRAGGLAEDAEGADLGGRPHMRAAAQLTRVLAVAHLHHAHYIAVLLPEQGHRPKPPRLLERGHHRPHGIIAGDPLIDAILDVDQLLLAQRVTVAEVEAQLVGAHVGARLAHVTAETLAQGRLQQVRGGVIALGGVPRSVVHLRQHRLARAQLTGLHGHGQRLVIAKTEHVAHVRSTVAALAFERSRVGDGPSDA